MKAQSKVNSQIKKESTIQLSELKGTEVDRLTKMLLRKNLELVELREKMEETFERLKEKTKELEAVRSALINMLEDEEEAKRKAEEEKDKTLAIITKFTDGLLVFNEKNTLVLINPQAELFFHAKPKELLEKSPEELLKIPRIKEVIKLLGKELRPIFRKELRLEGDLVLEVSSILMKKEKKKLGTIVILHDISREKMIEEMKTEFVSIAAHQLRTPLSAMKWSISLLKGESLKEPEKKEIMEKIYASNERMIKLINDLLNVTRIEEGKFLYRLKEMDITEVIKECIEQVKPQAKARKIPLIVKLPYQKPPFVKVDEEKFPMALQNLLTNAINYTLPSGKVTLTLEEKEKEILISVKDEGVGIPRSQRKRVFSKFFRGSNVMRMQTEGSGLGLYITKNIIEAHGGRIWFDSEEGKGTTFYFTLPLER